MLLLLALEDMNISREEQDEFAIESYRRSKEAWEKKLFEDEIICGMCRISNKQYFIFIPWKCFHNS